MPRCDVKIAREVNLDLIFYGIPEELPRERELLADRMMLTLGGSSAILRTIPLLWVAGWVFSRASATTISETSLCTPCNKVSRCFARTALAQRGEDGHYCHFAARAMAQHGDVCGNNRGAYLG